MYHTLRRMYMTLPLFDLTIYDKAMKQLNSLMTTTKNTNHILGICYVLT